MTPVELITRLSRQDPVPIELSLRVSEEEEGKHDDEDSPIEGSPIEFFARASAEAGPFELRLVTPSGHYMVIPLNDAEKKQFNDYCQTLSKGRSTASIDITNLHLVFKGDDDSFKTDYLDSDNKTIKDLRLLCRLVIDPKHKVRMNWQEIPAGARGNMAKAVPFAHLSPGLKARQMTDEQFEKSISALPTSAQKKARHRCRKIASEFVQGVKGALHTCASEDGVADARLDALQKASNQLDNLYSFAIDFEIAHPTFETADYDELSQKIDEKYHKALELLKEKSLKNRALETIGKRESLTSEEIDQLAKKLALNGIENRAIYEAQSKRLGLKSEADSLEWAIPRLARAIHDANEISDRVPRGPRAAAELEGAVKKIEEMINLLPFKQFLETLYPEDAKIISDFVKEQLVPGLGPKLSHRGASSRAAPLPLPRPITVV